MGTISTEIICPALITATTRIADITAIGTTNSATAMRAGTTSVSFATATEEEELGRHAATDGLSRQVLLLAMNHFQTQRIRSRGLSPRYRV